MTQLQLNLMLLGYWVVHVGAIVIGTFAGDKVCAISYLVGVFIVILYAVIHTIKPTKRRRR